jgi:hypothetical protein
LLTLWSFPSCITMTNWMMLRYTTFSVSMTSARMTTNFFGMVKYVKQKLYVTQQLVMDMGNAVFTVII